ncbi:hypothetical protein CEG14_14835 [Bordetella genomosp. 1]|uniref:Phage protein n=1 Tax=Bordetella genomosp. 1 TaxID=1395607 RepID=A0A261SGK8_9BORD|nr:phage tail assembly chaperone [Bordetella genomosp. 1]OZI36285.1 hypothetical protein CEG14_14835 [Bordetella genomosp. 1]
MAGKTKFSLKPNPTFKLAVPLPVPGGGYSAVQFTFKHRTKDEFKDFIENQMTDMEDTEMVLAVASGWELEEPFDEEHITTLVNNYVGSARAVFTAYIEELAKARTGN